MAERVTVTLQYDEASELLHAARLMRDRLVSTLNMDGLTVETTDVLKAQKGRIENAIILLDGSLSNDETSNR